MEVEQVNKEDEMSIWIYAGIAAVIIIIALYIIIPKMWKD